MTHRPGAVAPPAPADPHALGPAALATGAAIAWNNAVLGRLDRRLRLGPPGRAVATALFATSVAALLRRWPVADHRWPLVGAGSALGAYGLIAVRPARPAATPSGTDAPAPPRSAARLASWLLLEIPLGTAYAEETLFRGALTPALTAALGPHAGRAAGAAAFGLWHVGPAIAAGQRVRTVTGVTSAAGLFLDAVACRTRSLRTVFVMHAALNEIGAIANESWRSYRYRVVTWQNRGRRMSVHAPMQEDH